MVEGDDPSRSCSRRNDRLVGVDERSLEECHITISVNDPPFAYDPSGPERSKKVHADFQRGLKLVRLKCCEERRPNCIVEHRGDKGPEYVARGIGEVFSCRER